MSKSLSCWGWMGKRIVKTGLVVLLWGKNVYLYHRGSRAGQLPGETLELVWWYWKWSGKGALWHVSQIGFNSVSWHLNGFFPHLSKVAQMSLFLQPILQTVILFFFFSFLFPHGLFIYVNTIYISCVSFSFLLEGRRQESKSLCVDWCISNAQKVSGK